MWYFIAHTSYLFGFSQEPACAHRLARGLWRTLVWCVLSVAVVAIAFGAYLYFVPGTPQDSGASIATEVLSRDLLAEVLDTYEARIAAFETLPQLTIPDPSR